MWEPAALEAHRNQAEQATVSGGLTLPKARGGNA
jgi:hypothetical protein